MTFGLVVQLRLERAPELDRVLEFCQRWSADDARGAGPWRDFPMPTCRGVANAAFRNERNIANEQAKVTKQKLVQLMCEA